MAGRYPVHLILGVETHSDDTTKPCKSGLFSALLKNITEPGNQAVAIPTFLG